MGCLASGFTVSVICLTQNGMSGCMADILVCVYVCVCVCYVVATAGDTSKHNILESAQGDLGVGAGVILHLPDLTWPNDCRRHVLAPYATLGGGFSTWFTLRVSFCLC